jgi:2-polyprenyl-6-methoxyphenol hydroxylase-like FAD-dependent oxidoreductase
MVYMPVINPVLKGLGMLEIVKEQAYLNHTGVTWRNPEGEILGNLPLNGEGGEFGGTFQLGQARMNGLVMEEIKKLPSVEVRFGVPVVGVEDVVGSESVKVMVHQRGIADGDIIFHADYVLGTDGCNSSVRRILCIPFEGETFTDFKMITADVLYDFTSRMSYSPLNFFVHPSHWGVVAYTGEDGEGGVPEWRVAFVEPVDLPTGKEEILDRARGRISSFMKGETDFGIVRAESYWMHQRCAAQARKGRVMLAGDALHVRSPLVSPCAPH